MTLAKHIEQSWYSKRGFTLVLLPLAWLFGLIILLRRWCYRAGLFSRPDLPVPVIVVGNLAVGGTGKSPVVGWLVAELVRAGYTPGVVSRGYGADPHQEPHLVQADSDPAVCGDEPVMLAEQTGAPVCVCVDRVAAVMHLYRQGVDVVVADDGLQHYRMQRVAELVVVDGQRLYGNGQLMPAGPLREPLSRRNEVDAVLVNGGSEPDAVSFTLLPGQIVELDTDRQCALADFSGQRVWAVAGIGNPARFKTMLVEYGLSVDLVDVADHACVSLDSLREQRSQPILMTHKDAVKYRSSDTKDVWFIPVKVEIDAEQANGLLTRVKKKLTTWKTNTHQ